MKLKVLGSSSEGNCYLLENEKECLVIEAGLPFLEVKRALNYNIRKISGLILSHRHQDHAKYVTQFSKAGIRIFSSDEAEESLEIITGERVRGIEPLKRQKVGNFTIIPFEVPHVQNMICFGYIIEHEEMGRLLFATDLEYCPYKFKSWNLNHIMIEANHDINMVDRNIPNYEHTIRGHMDISTTADFIKANDNPLLTNIVLLHLSSVNSNREKFQQEIKNIAPYRNIYIAEKGLEIEVNLYPF